MARQLPDVGRTAWSAADLPVGLFDLRIQPLLHDYPSVTFYHRRLPHLYRADQPVFLTWRLHGSLPPHRSFPKPVLSSGESFAILDRLLDEARTGPFYLRQPAIADMVVNILHYNADVLGRYALHAFAVMPNHIHMLVSRHIPLPQLTKAVKGFTAKRANQMLGLTGNPFWQEESYDHLVRDQREWERIRIYKRVPLVQCRWATRRSPADLAVRPTL